MFIQSSRFNVKCTICYLVIYFPDGCNFQELTFRDPVQLPVLLFLVMPEDWLPVCRLQDGQIEVGV